eukprot:g3966.t1
MFADKTNMSTCLTCPYGFESPPGSAKCTETCKKFNLTYDDEQCKECEEGKYSTKSMGIKAPLMFVLMLVGISVMIAMQIKDSSKTAEMEVIKIFLSSCNCLAVLGEYPLQWSEGVESLLSVAGMASAGSQDVFSPDCLQSAALFWALIYILRRRTAKNDGARLVLKHVRTRMNVSVIIIAFFFLPTMNALSWQLFSCRKVGSSLSRMSLDPDIECFGSIHTTWVLGLAVPSLLIYSLGTPLFTTALLWRLKRSKKLNVESSESSKLYSFLYGGFKGEYYYFEGVLLLRKLSLNAIRVIFDNAPRIQALAATLILLMAWIVQLVCSPYRYEKEDGLIDLNKVESSETGLQSASISTELGEGRRMTMARRTKTSRRILFADLSLA